MDMKAQTRNSVLTAMVCVALSSGTAWAAVPEVQVPAVQQSSGTSAASLAQAAVADVVEKEKAKERAARNLSFGGTKSEAGKEVQQQAETEPAAVTAAKMRSMPLHWSALKPKEEQVQKAQPIIITADDIDAKRKEEKRAAAAQAARGAQKKAGTENSAQPKVSQPAPAPQIQVPAVQAKPISGISPVQKSEPAPQALQPKQENSGQVVQPAANPAVPAAKLQEEQKPVVPVPQAKPAVQQEYRPPQPQAKVEELPRQEPVVAEARPQPRPMVKLHPEGLYGSRRQKPLAEPSGQMQEQKQPAYKEEREYRPQEAPQQPARTVQPPLPQQIHVERPPEYEGISDEVVRHIMAGEYAMRYQLSRDASEPGVYHVARILYENTGLSHLQKIEYLMGFGRAINRSNLSEYQKKALIDAVLQAFGEKQGQRS